MYVGGLPYATTDQELKDYFAGAGNVVSASVIMDKMTNRSRGFGFVEMATAEEANKAIELFNEKDFGGRTLIVNIAKPKEEGSARPRRSFGDRGGRGYRSDNAY